MTAMFSEKAQAVLTFMQANTKADLTASIIAENTGIEKKSITGVLNGLARKGLIERVEVEGQKDKLVRLTADGLVVDPEAEKPAADAE